MPLRAFIPGPVGGNPSFYPDNPHYTEVIPTPATVSVMRGMSPAYLASQRTSPGFPVCAVRSLIYTLTGGPGGNFPRVCGDVCGDEPDRHAYMLDFGQIIVYLSRTQFPCMPEKAASQPTLAVHYRLHHTVLTSNLARVVKSMGDLQEAERLFREAIAMDPEFAEYHQDFASFLSDMGRFEEAAVEAGRTVELDPSIDVQVVLNDLQARFPNDELINEAVHLNSNTE